jgi:RecG-like helicase
MITTSVDAGIATIMGTPSATPPIWLVERYPPGTKLLLHGRPDNRGGFAVAHHSPASATAADDGAPAVTGEVDSVAHYPASEGVSSTEILNLVREAAPALRDVLEALPAATRIGEGLPDRPSALAAMHFPRTPTDLEEGRRRLAFEEMLLTQLMFLRRRAQRAQRTGAQFRLATVCAQSSPSVRSSPSHHGAASATALDCCYLHAHARAIFRSTLSHLSRRPLAVISKPPATNVKSTREETHVHC